MERPRHQQSWEDWQRTDFPTFIPQVNAYRQLIIQSRPLLDGPVSPIAISLGSEEAHSQHVKEYARFIGADLVGVAEVDESCIYESVSIPHRYAISLAMAMDYAKLKTAPSIASSIEGLRVAWALGEVAIRVAAHIRELGHCAQAEPPYPQGSPDRRRRILHIPHAIAAGLGELGKNGLLLTHEFGPRVLIATVTTDFPLPIDGAQDMGLALRCQDCSLCFLACRGGAICEDKQEIRGVYKWAIDPKKHIAYSNQLREAHHSQGCGICLKVCPIGRPQTPERSLAATTGT
ncbi:MAG: hypothetical protein HYU86_03045 [Chloroflexi bacterium]|nr:hypothetical protein [Chloroflexota bacterium]